MVEKPKVSIREKVYRRKEMRKQRKKRKPRSIDVDFLSRKIERIKNITRNQRCVVLTKDNFVYFLDRFDTYIKKNAK